jgi:hypothetical protein
MSIITVEGWLRLPGIVLLMHSIYNIVSVALYEWSMYPAQLHDQRAVMIVVAAASYALFSSIFLVLAPDCVWSMYLSYKLGMVPTSSPKLRAFYVFLAPSGILLFAIAVVCDIWLLPLGPCSTLECLMPIHDMAFAVVMIAYAAITWNSVVADFK